eukprot:CAMPEP_0168760912 /NCGR_PEP_ID=MMETSP0724-20121128/23019_1 /TAXON_ID=265536 /ORGANISM="Amphiprora sp., Strain CCMP467" /LENGTH=294 /DNA_ID=CAMNT_0008809953 /DNA_START=228 /DNA_END=1109 /DNA_ORIENTATION=-
MTVWWSLPTFHNCNPKHWVRAWKLSTSRPHTVKASNKWRGARTFLALNGFFFDRWYVIRDWMRATNTPWIFTTDSDALVTVNITALAQHNADTLASRRFWIHLEAPRSCWPFAFLSLEFLDDITSFWRTLMRPDVWTTDNVAKFGINDMIALGIYISLNEYPNHSCLFWDNQSQQSPGSCDTAYSDHGILKRLVEHNAKAQYPAGSLAYDGHGRPTFLGPGHGIVDKNYLHDPTGSYDIHVRSRQKKLRFSNGQPLLALKNGTWLPHWGYILEDALENCVDVHMQHLLNHHNCT